MSRYQRQIILDGWGNAAQEKLKASTVFIAGVGGLGSPVAMNLTLAGVGHITLCDADTVDMSNLNRQFLHKEKNIGVDKTHSALITLSAINSDVEFATVSQKITTENADELIGDADIIMDCLDNFAGRFALNRYAVEKGIPMVHGAVWGMEGRVSFLNPPLTPCLSCIFPESPPLENIPVLGAVTMATGSLQAIEAIQYLIGSRPALANKILIADYSSFQFQELEVSRNNNCQICGQLSTSPSSE